MSFGVKISGCRTVLMCLAVPGDSVGSWRKISTRDSEMQSGCDGEPEGGKQD